MNRIRLVISLSVVLAALAQSHTRQTQTEINLLPRPDSIVVSDGVFRLTDETSITADRELWTKAEQLRGFLSPATGYSLPINTQRGDRNVIRLHLVSSASSLGEEGYELVVTPKNVTIRARTPQGVFWGMQSLRQLFSGEILREAKVDSVEWVLPCLKVVDKPRFRWRGLMIDFSRTFWNAAVTKKYIDALSFYKMNKLHMHLTDDQGWRLEIQKFPRLTEVGSRFDTVYHEPPEREGYFTKDDIRELVRYAKERNVELIPEIEMPGHTVAALAAYPDLSCTGEKVSIQPFGVGPGVHEEVLCPGKKGTFRFLEGVLAEVSGLFPSRYIHIGGDEVPKTRWKACPDCQKVIKDYGLKDEAELQSWFTKEVEKIVNANGKKLIGWDEITEGGLSTTVTVMFWRGMGDDLLRALHQGSTVILTPTSHCYFDYSYETTPTEKVYSFEPITEKVVNINIQQILGVQANFWSHIDRTEPQMDRQLFPRLLALAEVGWSDENRKDWNEFNVRLQSHYEALTLLKIKDVYIQPPIR